MYRHPAEPAAAALLHRGSAAEASTNGTRSGHHWEADGQNALADAMSVVSTHACAFSPELRWGTGPLMQCSALPSQMESTGLAP